MIYLELNKEQCIKELKEDPNRVVGWMKEIAKGADLMKRVGKDKKEILKYLRRNRWILVGLKQSGYASMTKQIARIDLMMSKV